LGAKAAYDDLQIAMNLSPSPTVWLPVAGGIPMPDSVLNSYQMPAVSLSTACGLEKLMIVAAKLRLLMLGPGSDSQTWQPYSTSIDLCCCLLLKDGDRTRFDAPTRIAADDFERIHGRSPHVPIDAAKIIAQTLWGDSATLWDLLLYLTGMAKMGAAVASVVGPVGAGKSFTIIAFAALFFAVCDGRLAVVCQANSPLDDTAKLAHTVLSGMATVIRATSHSHFNKIDSSLTATKQPWHRCLVTARDGIHIPEGPALVLATTAIVAMTRRGAPVLPEQFAEFTF
jgi:hypothetical protein